MLRDFKLLETRLLSLLCFYWVYYWCIGKLLILYANVAFYHFVENVCPRSDHFLLHCLTSSKNGSLPPGNWSHMWISGARNGRKEKHAMFPEKWGCKIEQTQKPKSKKGLQLKRGAWEVNGKIQEYEVGNGIVGRELSARRGEQASA